MNEPAKLPENLFDVQAALPEEVTDILVNGHGVRVERITSHGHRSPDGFWYDQEEHEWVVVLQGAARLEFEGKDDSVELQAGDHVNIPAHRRHRVAWTTPDEPTIWLAVFYG